MGWLKKTSFTLAFLLIPDIIYPTITNNVNWCHLSALASSLVRFGDDGSNGGNGNNGTSGRDSESITIFADGSPLNLTLVGQNGSSGEAGQDGRRASCQTPPQQQAQNLIGANGGNGGDGGDGGDGGKGGNITIYATDPNYLQSITVNANGGHGGKGGMGGAGGEGCACLQPFWTMQTCSGSPGSANYNCTTQEYKCTNGETGQGGRYGRNGRDGSLGRLTLINSNQPLAPDRLSASVTMTELKERGFSLSKNIWATRKGAGALFAQGSRIDDEYLALAERLQNAVVLIWNAPQSFQPFGGRTVTLSLDDNGQVAVNTPNDVWFQQTINRRNGVTEIFVFNALQASQATQLKSQGISGVGKEVKWEIIDEAEKSDLVDTRFRLRYSTSLSGEARFREVNDYTERYSAEIPPQFIRYDNNRFVINIGQLPMPERHLEGNSAIKVDLEVIRSLGDRTATQNITERTIINPFR